MYMVPKLDEDNNVLSAPVLLIASFVVSFLGLLVMSCVFI